MKFLSEPRAIIIAAILGGLFLFGNTYLNNKSKEKEVNYIILPKEADSPKPKMKTVVIDTTFSEKVKKENNPAKSIPKNTSTENTPDKSETDITQNNINGNNIVVGKVGGDFVIGDKTENNK